MRDICRCHQACGHEPRVAISPVLNIYEVLRSGEQCALAELVRRGWMVHFMLQLVQQVLHNPGRDTGLLGRVDKAKEDEIIQEHPPVCSEAPEQPMPVKIHTTRVQKVHNVRPVIAFTLHDIALGPEHFFWWAEVHGNPQRITSHSMGKPCLINRGDAVARAKDHVDTIRVAARLAQPVRKGQLRVKPCGVEDLESVGTMVRVYKNIKILGMARNPGIMCQGISTTYKKRPLRCLQGHQRPTVKSAGMGSRFTPKGGTPEHIYLPL